MVGIDNLADQSIILSETIQSLTKEQKKEFNKKLKHKRKKNKKEKKDCYEEKNTFWCGCK